MPAPGTIVLLAARFAGLSLARATCSSPPRSRRAATCPIPRSTPLIAVERLPLDASCSHDALLPVR